MPSPAAMQTYMATGGEGEDLLGPENTENTEDFSGPEYTLIMTMPIPDRENVHAHNHASELRVRGDPNRDPFSKLPYWDEGGGFIEEYLSPLTVDENTKQYSLPSLDKTVFRLIPNDKRLRQEALRPKDWGAPKYFRRVTRNTWQLAVFHMQVKSSTVFLDMFSDVSMIINLGEQDGKYKDVPASFTELYVGLFLTAQLLWFFIAFSRALAYRNYLHADTRFRALKALAALTVNFMLDVPRDILEAPKIFLEGSQSDDRPVTKHIVPNSGSYVYSLRYRDLFSYNFFSRASLLARIPTLLLEDVCLTVMNVYMAHNYTGGFDKFMIISVVISFFAIVGTAVDSDDQCVPM